MAARWGQSCVLIGYLCRLDGLILPSQGFSPCSWEEKKYFFILSRDIILFYPFLTKLVLSTYWPHSFLTNIQLPCTLTPHLINRIKIKETIPMCLLILIKPQVAVHESTAPIQENPHGGNQENWEEGIPMGALLWLGSHRDRWAGAYAQNGQNTVQVCTSAAQNGVSHPHPTHNKVCYTRSDEKHWVLKALFILFCIVFASPWKADRIVLLFTHRNGCAPRRSRK